MKYFHDRHKNSLVNQNIFLYSVTIMIPYVLNVCSLMKTYNILMCSCVYAKLSLQILTYYLWLLIFASLEISTPDYDHVNTNWLVVNTLIINRTHS